MQVNVIIGEKFVLTSVQYYIRHFIFCIKSPYKNKLRYLFPLGKDVNHFFKCEVTAVISDIITLNPLMPWTCPHRFNEC